MKRSLIGAMIGHKCAVCRQGDMFPTGAYSFDRPFTMNERCPKCNANLEPEPGFYYGAMFVSYVLLVFPLLGLTMFLKWILGWSIEASFALIIGLGLLILVWWFRFSRAVWLNLMVKYDRTVAKEVEMRG
ncbi:MAG: DUF983 domain-containing protein [Bacteroidota bacterium]